MTVSCVDTHEGPCPHPNADEPNAWHVGGCHYSHPADAFHIGVLGFCGCNQPELIVGIIRDYLKLLDERTNGSPGFGAGTQAWDAWWKPYRVRYVEAFDNNATLRALVEYVCDAKELTDHGGSVGGAWLTDLGKEWLDRLNAA